MANQSVDGVFSKVHLGKTEKDDSVADVKIFKAIFWLNIFEDNMHGRDFVAHQELNIFIGLDRPFIIVLPLHGIPSFV